MRSYISLKKTDELNMTFITVKRVFSYLSSFFQELTRQLWTLLSLVRFRYCIQLMFIVFVFFSFTYWIVAAYATNYQHLIRLKMKLMNDDNNNISNREITAVIDITTSNHSTKDDVSTHVIYLIVVHMVFLFSTLSSNRVTSNCRTLTNTTPLSLLYYWHHH